MSDVYDFGREFRLKLITLCTMPSWIGKVGLDIIKPEYFEADDESEAVAAIHEYYTRYDSIPRDPADVSELCDNEDAVDLVYDVYGGEYAHDLDMPMDVAIQWAREQAVKQAVLDSVVDIKRGNLDAIITRTQEALSVGRDLATPGIDVFRDTDKWLYNQWIDAVPTGWTHLDIHLEGGASPGELGVILAPSNKGKSMALVNIAFGAAAIPNNKNVVLFTHELHPKKYAKRFGARTVFRFPDKNGDILGYEEEFHDIFGKLVRGNIRIIGGKKMTTNEIEHDLRRLVDDGFIPDVVIDDYGDLIIAPTKRDQRRFELTETYEWLRGLGAPGNITEIGFPVWTASQVGRQAYGKEIITVADIAEDIGKVNTADTVIAICQTGDEEMLDQCRLFLAKARDHEDGAMFNAKFYKRQQAIVCLGKTQRRIAENV